MWDEEKHKCYIRHDLVFNEFDFGKGSVNEIEVDVNKRPAEVQKQEEDESVSGEHGEQPEMLRRSERVSKKPVHYGFDEFTNVATHVAYLEAKIEEPSTIECAVNGEYCKKWKSAANLEYSSLMENET